MKYNLINPINPKYSAVEQILTNRGIAREEIDHYLHTGPADVAPPTAFGLDLLRAAARELITAVNLGIDTFIIVDADCDGFTSSALIWNYLHDAFPSWATTHLHYLLHDSKQHGLSDHMEFLTEERKNSLQPLLIIVPDAGSNDASECKKLNDLNCAIIILDHHICDVKNDYAFVINNQNCDYPNKNLAGVGVTWQFCRFLDSLLSQNYADQYLDLVAVGLVADMMSLHSLETKHLVQEGLKEENLKNPFIVYMVEKNNYSIGNKLTPNGVAFYVAPLVNAIVRSGSEEEKSIVFESMLKDKAFFLIPSTKRGHKPGDMEKIVEQAMRVATNVKARQTKAQDAGIELLEGMINARQLLSHKVLLFLVEPGQIDRNIAGLVANKFMAKYQRPCCILTKVKTFDNAPWEDPHESISYQGSARGCDAVGVTEFKSLCMSTGMILYASGHEGAFGLGIAEENLQGFIDKTDELLADMPDEPVYRVDYIWNENEMNGEAILEIADLDSLWGKDLDQPLVVVKNLRVTSDQVSVYEKRGYTIRIDTKSDVPLVLFRASEEDCLRLHDNNTGYIDIDVIAKCNKNEWMGQVSPQLLIQQYEILDSNKYFF